MLDAKRPIEKPSARGHDSYASLGSETLSETGSSILEDEEAAESEDRAE